jgi:hypothetical protein
MADAQILSTAQSAAPSTYLIPGGQEIIVKVLKASFDGTAAAAAWRPAVQLLGPGGIDAGVFPLSGSALAAGASADVTWFRGVGGGSSGGGGGTRTVAVPVNTPDGSGNGFPALTTLNGFANVRRVVAAFINGALGTWEGAIEVPADYASGGIITLTWAANAVAGNLRNRVGSEVVATGVTLDGAYTQEAYVATTVQATANRRFQSTFALSTVLVAGSTLALQITRDGGNAADTLAVAALLVGCDLTYTAGY